YPKSLTSELQLPQFIADVDQNLVFGFFQAGICLLDCFVFRSKFVFLSSPVKNFPGYRHSQVRKVFWNRITKIARRQIGETSTDIGNVLRLLDASIECCLLYQQTRLLQLWPLLYRGPSGL